MTLIQKAEVLLECGVMELPIALGIRAVRARRRENRAPQLVEGNLIRHAREHLPSPSHDWRAGDAPRVEVEIEPAAEDRTLGVPRLGGSSGLCRIDAGERFGVRALDKDEAGTCLGKRIQLHPLPGGHLLEPRYLDVLVRQARDRIVSPNNRDMTGTGAIRLSDELAHEGTGLDRRLDHNLLSRTHIYALADDKSSISLDSGLERLHTGAGVLDGQSGLDHGCSFTVPYRRERWFFLGPRLCGASSAGAGASSPFVPSAFFALRLRSSFSAERSSTASTLLSVMPATVDL